jgi:hypothetical protein
VVTGGGNTGSRGGGEPVVTGGGNTGSRGGGEPVVTGGGNTGGDEPVVTIVGGNDNNGINGVQNTGDNGINDVQTTDIGRGDGDNGINDVQTTDIGRDGDNNDNIYKEISDIDKQLEEAREIRKEIEKKIEEGTKAETFVEYYTDKKSVSENIKRIDEIIQKIQDLRNRASVLAREETIDTSTNNLENQILAISAQIDVLMSELSDIALEFNITPGDDDINILFNFLSTIQNNNVSNNFSYSAEPLGSDSDKVEYCIDNTNIGDKDCIIVGPGIINPSTSN